MAIFLIISIIPTLAFAELIDSPRKQIQKEIAPTDVFCKYGFTLMIKGSGTAACVKPSTATKLENDGWES